MGVEQTAETFHAGQSRLLELIAKGVQLQEILNSLLLLMESQSPGLYCSVLLLDEDGVHICGGAGPNMPAEYMAALDGYAIGPSAGSCGTAMYRKEMVVVSDLLSDPLWAPYKHLVEPHGFRASWSKPIFLNSHTVLGSFAMYYKEVRIPGAAELALMDVATHIAGIAIERAQREHELLRHRFHLESLIAARTAELSDAKAQTDASNRSLSAMEESMRRALDEQRTIFDNAGVGIMYVHRRVITRCNQQLARILGYAVEDLVGQSTRLFYENEEHYKTLGREGYQVLLQGRTFDIEMPIKHRDGHKVLVRSTASLVAGSPVDSGDVIWVMEDVSERWEAQEALRRTQAELVAAEKMAALGSLVAGVAHELNTPVGNALVAASTLQQRSQDLRAAVADGNLKRSQLDGFVTDLSSIGALITRSCERAAQLISGFKQLAVGRGAELRASASVLSVVEGVVASQPARPAEAVVSIHYDIAPDVVYEGYLYPLMQIVGALVENAMVHAFVGRTHGVLRISARVADGWIDLRFADDGVGMDAGTLARVFDPFFTTRLGHGRSGLGLALTRNVATAVLGGQIDVQSRPGEGACFSLRFPAVAP